MSLKVPVPLSLYALPNEKAGNVFFYDFVYCPMALLLLSYVYYLSHPGKCFYNLGPFPNDQCGSSSILLVFGTFFCIYDPGPTIPGVEEFATKGDCP